jgi:hypothetical protein
MFLDVAARPSFDCYGDMTFDGKLGIWLFIYMKKRQNEKARTEMARTMLISLLTW